ncbi:MAG: hypothetical protein KKF44_00155 [Nanoarchaeota archaeon]|nr:hypothetical protein [Nanoarchaeota archaeon]
MIKVPKEVIIQKIKEKTGLSDSEIKSKIEEKLKQLSGLISEEGAAHIIANQMGVKIIDESAKLKIKDILPGMKKVDVVARVIKAYEIREFENEQRKGKLGSFLIGDETGVIRVVAWNDKADIVADLEENMGIKIESAYARENRNGGKEIHIADRGTIILNPDEDIPEVKQRSDAARKKIAELSDNESDVEILGTIVQAFDPRFFEVCPQCSKRARPRDGAFFCDTHSKVEPAYAYVMNLFVDDGTETVRVVLWRNQIQNLVKKSHEDIIAMKDASFEEIKNDLLGQIVKLTGRTSKNEMFDRIEFIAQTVFRDPDPEQEIERLEKENKEDKAEPLKAVTKKRAEKPVALKEKEDVPAVQEDDENDVEEVLNISTGDDDSADEDEVLEEEDLSEKDILDLDDLEKI